MATLSAKKLARQSIKEQLEKDMFHAKVAVGDNRLKFQRLTEEQTILKRKVSELHSIIKMLEDL